MCFILLGARGRTRTDTPLRVQDFESSASTIPPLGQILLLTSCCLSYIIQFYFTTLFYLFFSVFYNFLFLGAPGRTRTGTRIRNLILSQTCLPFHHWGNSTALHHVAYLTLSNFFLLHFSLVFQCFFSLRCVSFFFGARGRTRTDTPLRVQDFESSASTIPPLGQFVLRYIMFPILHQSISFYYIFCLFFSVSLSYVVFRFQMTQSNYFTSLGTQYFLSTSDVSFSLLPYCTSALNFPAQLLPQNGPDLP